MERYEKILEIRQDTVQNSCPVFFVKGALLKDHKLECNILQLQFQSIALKKIQAIFVEIQCFDIEKQIIETVEHTYLDFDVSYGMFFGERLPIKLQSDLSRKFEVRVKKVVFTDGSSYGSSGTQINLEEKESLNHFGELKEQFVREVKNLGTTIPCTYKPLEKEAVWHCTCGAINFKDNKNCGSCGVNRIKLFALMDMTFLTERKAEFLRKAEADRLEHLKKVEADRLERERLAEIARQKAEEEVAKRAEEDKIRVAKNRKIAMIVIPIVCVIVGVMIYINTVVVQNNKYNNAMALMKEGKYQEAIVAFEEVGDYKDADDLLKKCKEEKCKIEEMINELSIYCGKYQYGRKILEVSFGINSDYGYIEVGIAEHLQGELWASHRAELESFQNGTYSFELGFFNKKKANLKGIFKDGIFEMILDGYTIVPQKY